MTYETNLSRGERVASLFQPDILLPVQHLETSRRKVSLEPEKRLMLAVLEDAIACFQRYVFAREKKGRTLFCETEEWILEKSSDYPFSFGNICEVLGLNPQYIRQGLIRWKERQQKGGSRNPRVMVSRRPDERLRQEAGHLTS